MEPKPFTRVLKLYSAVQKERNEYTAKQIDETLKSGETAIVLVREGHQVQFPPDIQVFYVAPPALDEIRCRLRERETETQNQSNKDSRS